MTITQKILAKHAGCNNLAPGQLIEAEIDLAMANDITGPVAINELENAVLGVKYPDRVAFVLDHFTPCKDIKSAENCSQIREFARKNGIASVFEGGNGGIEHVLLPDLGFIAPGELVIGADSHTCTYGALGAFSTGVGSTDMAYGMATGKAWFKVPRAMRFSFTGKLGSWVSGKDVILHILSKIGVDGALYKSMEFFGVGALNIDDRLTIANMSIEAGAKNAVFEVDSATKNYIADKISRDYDVFTCDSPDDYDEHISVDLSALRLQVARPHLPSNAVPVDEISGIGIHQVLIGSCTNGRLSDIRIAASVLKGRRVAEGVRCIVIPATQKVYLDAVREGLVETLVEAGAVFSAPTCGPCLGGHTGVLGANERCVSTTNRNFIGRMGHRTSEVYLTGPAVAAASAVAGEICSPDML